MESDGVILNEEKERLRGEVTAPSRDPQLFAQQTDQPSNNNQPTTIMSSPIKVGMRAASCGSGKKEKYELHPAEVQEGEYGALTCAWLTSLTCAWLALPHRQFLAQLTVWPPPLSLVALSPYVQPRDLASALTNVICEHVRDPGQLGEAIAHVHDLLHLAETKTLGASPPTPAATPNRSPFLRSPPHGPEHFHEMDIRTLNKIWSRAMHFAWCLVFVENPHCPAGVPETALQVCFYAWVSCSTMGELQYRSCCRSHATRSCNLPSLTSASTSPS